MCHACTYSSTYSFIYGVFTGLSKRKVRGKIIAIHHRKTHLEGTDCADLSLYRQEGPSRCNSECLVLKAVIIQNACNRSH